VTTEGVDSHTATLPAGEWVHAFTGEQVTGGGTHTTEVPWDEAPVYVREEAWPSLRTVFGS
jgi:alpha-glucosidase (family GH31 glycosyl hydrolase)